MNTGRVTKAELQSLADMVLAAWRQGHDTSTIARTLIVSESVAYRIIAAEQNRRYAERMAARTAEAAHA